MQKKRKSGTAEKRGKSGNFPQKVEEVATLMVHRIEKAMKNWINDHKHCID
jgi:hypothetical protein